MNELIIGQVRFLLMTSLLGMALMGTYDICRFLRWMIPHHKVVVALEDLVFWASMSIPAYGLFFLYNDGEIRWYGALAVLLGGFLYEWGISMPVRRLGDRYLGIPKRKFIRFLRKIRRRVADGIKKLLRNVKRKQMKHKTVRQENKKRKEEEKRDKKVHRKTKKKLHKMKK